VGYVDRLITPGRLYYGNFDPEGLLSTLPAVVTAMLGMFTGEFVRRTDVPERKKSGYMGLAALVLLGVGLLWSLSFPINKSLWSSSFVLVVGSYSLAMFALFYEIIDVRGYQKWAFPFIIIGLNSVTIYLAQRIIPFDEISGFFLNGAASMLSPDWAKVLLDVGYLAVSWLFLYFLYRKKTFLKI
jgi:predicted acyltransferase